MNTSVSEHKHGHKATAEAIQYLLSHVLPKGLEVRCNPRYLAVAISAGNPVGFSGNSMYLHTNPSAAMVVAVSLGVISVTDWRVRPIGRRVYSQRFQTEEIVEVFLEAMRAAMEETK